MSGTAHRLRVMAGRDPHEQHRVATPLELLFDLTFVVGFGTAASQFAHALTADHVFPGLISFLFATFAICWAWINFTWFASAYDTDDWMYRVTTMVQMVGVVILTLGIPDVFASIEHGEHVDNAVLVAGYVVMRVGLIAQWLRAAAQDAPRRRACLTYATLLGVVQIGWIAQIFTHTSLPVTAAWVGLMLVLEMAVPVVAERWGGGTPWHAHHISERYGLMAIIALGEGVVGTVATLSAVVQEQGWSVDAILVTVAGIGLTFGMWWVFFTVPTGDLLHAHREQSFWFGYLPIFLFGSIVATGAGLHVAAYYLEGNSKLGSVGTVFSVVIPVGLFVCLVFLIYSILVRQIDWFHLLLLVLTAAVLVGSVLLALGGVSMALCLLVATAAPMVSVVGYELVGHRHMADAMERRLVA
ncbi:low temperature requirement A [Mycolicibacterium cosmeticum]|uniref:Low temperature requirement A n=2 Tax=Mycolicibacterium cosmeticum TaxID=258533 RepID=W9AK60_MYCCO|nr:low temperature requirement A [Mycolicibacterium cosmeticum]